MNDENKEMINTEEPIKVSDKEKKILMDALQEAASGEFISQEEMDNFFEGMKKRIIDYRQKSNLLKVGS